MSRSVAESAAIRIDPYDHALQDDPYPLYRRLRDEDPFHHDEGQGFWVISRHADVHAAVRHDHAFSNRMGVSLDASAWNEHAHLVMSFLAMDPPCQTRLRRLVARGFTPRRVAAMQTEIQQITDRHLDRLLATGGVVDFDWIGDLVGRIPMDVISQMLGVPESDREEVRRLADLLVVREDGLRDVPAAGIEAAFQLFDYYREHVAQRHRQPTDDLTSALLLVQDDGDRMSDEEVVAFLFLMVVAGNETTTKLLGNALVHLTRNPEQQACVWSDPALVPTWIEETLRHDTSTQLLARLLVEDLTLHGRTAPAGSQVLLALGSANHDERVFTDPETFSLDRPQSELAQILSFGGGRHFCLGANLARLESRVILDELVTRVSHVEVDHARCRRFYSANVRGYARVPVQVTVR